MIGGRDLVLTGAPADGEIAFVVERLRTVWPELVVQDANRVVAVPPDAPDVAAMREIFAYRSRTDFEAWRGAGATPENADSMIHVIIGQDSATFVTAEPPAETHVYGSALRDVVATHRVLIGLPDDVRTYEPGAQARFLELLSDVVMKLPADDADEAERRRALEHSWTAMSLDERAEARASLLGVELVAPVAPELMGLVDRAVEIGEHDAPRRAA